MRIRERVQLPRFLYTYRLQEQSQTERFDAIFHGSKEYTVSTKTEPHFAHRHTSVCEGKAQRQHIDVVAVFDGCYKEKKVNHNNGASTGSWLKIYPFRFSAGEAVCAWQMTTSFSLCSTNVYHAS